jgi:hypothetical protein
MSYKPIKQQQAPDVSEGNADRVTQVDGLKSIFFPPSLLFYGEYIISIN